MAKKYWIMKSEPNEFGIDDLKEKDQAFWDGVRNYQVRNMFRDDMKVGDRALFYHSNTAEIGVMGEMKIVASAKPDPTQFVLRHKYFDSKSKPDNPRWLGPTVGFISKFKRVVTLEELRDNQMFSDFAFVKKGNRLSVTELSKDQYEEILTLAKKKMI